MNQADNTMFNLWWDKAKEDLSGPILMVRNICTRRIRPIDSVIAPGKPFEIECFRPIKIDERAVKVIEEMIEYQYTPRKKKCV